ncbi:hypothetical protein [Streptomyces mayteni]
MSDRHPDVRTARFQRARDAAAFHAARGKWRAAVRASRRAERIVLRLRRSEPSNPQHIWVLGATCYNQAGLWERLGPGRLAVKAALRAFDAYRWLDPSKVDPRGVREALRSGGDGPAQPAALIAHTADAAACLARLLAVHQALLRPGDTPSLERFGQSVRGQADVLGHTAVRMYQELIANGHYGQEDLSRVRKQHAAAVEHLYGPSR